MTNVAFDKLDRIPIGADGVPGTPVDIWMDAPVRGPDGLRVAGGRLFLAEGGGGRVVALSIRGDTAHVTVVRDGPKAPTGVQPAGGTLRFTERGTGKVWAAPLPRQE